MPSDSHKIHVYESATDNPVKCKYGAPFPALPQDEGPVDGVCVPLRLSIGQRDLEWLVDRLQESIIGRIDPEPPGILVCVAQGRCHLLFTKTAPLVVSP